MSQQKADGLAPGLTSPTQTTTAPFTSLHNVPPSGETSPLGNSSGGGGAHRSASLSNADLQVQQQTDATEPTRVRKSLGKWNPFEDPTPFSQMTEDHIFDAEFDAIRQRGSQTSKYIRRQIAISRNLCHTKNRCNRFPGITSLNKGQTPPQSTRTPEHIIAAMPTATQPTLQHHSTTSLVSAAGDAPLPSAAQPATVQTPTTGQLQQQPTPTTTTTTTEDPFGSAPFSMPATLLERAASLKKTGGKA